MADNCGMCLSLDEKFECGWCQSSGKCEVKDKCGKDATSWLNRDQTCPNPQITSFEPMIGPWEGGTNITITGINLGKEYLDIYGGITVAGIQCDPYERLYRKTEKIVCKVDGPGTKVTVTISAVFRKKYLLNKSFQRKATVSSLLLKKLLVSKEIVFKLLI
jgi:plexin A